MRLTTHTDYALRVLIALAATDSRLMTIEELAERHSVSRNHLMKVVQTLVGHGLVRSVRGRKGGLTLALPASEIRVGRTIRMLETDQALVACLGSEPENCVLTGCCRLTSALRGALESFFRDLDRLTLADLVVDRVAIRKRLELVA